MSQASYDADRAAREAGARKIVELESGIELARRELETTSSLFETTKRANAALEREATARRSEAEDAARRVEDVEASLAEKSNEADEAAHLVDVFEAAQTRLRVETGRLAEHLDASKREVAALFGKIERREDSREETRRRVEDARRAAEAKIEGVDGGVAEVTRRRRRSATRRTACVHCEPPRGERRDCERRAEATRRRRRRRNEARRWRASRRRRGGRARGGGEGGETSCGTRAEGRDGRGRRPKRVSAGRGARRDPAGRRATDASRTTTSTIPNPRAREFDAPRTRRRPFATRLDGWRRRRTSRKIRPRA